MSPRVKTVLLASVTLAAIVANRLLPTTAPMWIQALALLLAGALAIASLLHAPPGVVDTIATLLGAVTQGKTLDESTPAVAAARRTLKRSRSMLPISMLALLLMWSPPAAVVVSTSSCNASGAQIGATILDGLKLAGCIIPQVLSGITDPEQLLVCEGATEDLIIAAVDDFTAQKRVDGGLASIADLNGITPAQRTYLAEARQKAITRKAARAGR